VRAEGIEGRGGVTVDTKRFDIQPLLGCALPDAAAFLDRWHADGDQGASTERRLRWLLEENPLATAISEHGLCIRDAAGAIVGLLLSFPGAFRAGDRRILALGSGGYFVEPPARTLGFYLFKRHLSRPGFAFFFSTTCNATSGALWKMLGAGAVSNSDAEYVLPLDLEVMLPSFLDGRTSSTRAANVARVVGRWAKAVRRRAAETSAGVITEPCRDWEKLADLSRRHRSADWITTDRSAAFLQWRYGPSSPNRASDIRVFRDRRGHEGWFVLERTIRGLRRQIRGRVLLDATWPRDTMSFDDVLAAVCRAAAPDADAIYFRPRLGVDHGEYRRWIIRRRREPPSVFAIAGKGGAPLAVSSLDLVPADGDDGFPDGDS